jgi:hypothetical protein
VLVLLAVCVIGLGFYLGWFGISTAKETTGKTGVNVTIDQDKIKADAEKARQKAKDVLNRGTTQTEKKATQAEKK